jgi:OPT family oligopeptide transporter
MQPQRYEGLAEFTLKAVAAGVLLGVVFGAANVYLGLRVGMTVSASIPAAVMTVALFKLIRARGSLLEANLSQTIGSASTSLASGTIFTIPALFLWGMAPPYFQVVALCFLGGVLGLSAMIPLRRMLIVEARDELPYPEGTACAEVLRATAAGAGGGAWIFWGMGIGAAVKVLISLLFLLPGDVRAELPVLPKAEVALELAPALVGVGFILGYRQSAVCMAGAVISALALTPLIGWMGEGMSRPLYPEPTRLIAQMSSGDIWSRYVRYIGAGAVATAGILSVLRGLPAMAGAFLAIARRLPKRHSDSHKPDASVRGTQARSASKGTRESQIRSASKETGSAEAIEGQEPERTDRDLPGGFVVGGILFVVVVAGLVPGIFAGEMGAVQRAVCAAGVGVFGILFVAVAARIVGIVGVSSQPISGMTLVTLLGVASVFAAAGWTDPEARAAVLTVGTIVAVAASKAGDISQDLKTGYLVGATPARQQLGQLIGASVACWAVAGALMLLGSAYEFGSAEIPAPQATLMKTVIEGVLAGDLPWGLVLTGAGLSVGAMLCGVSGLAFAIGVYLPFASMAPLFVGGCVRVLVERGRSGQSRQSDPGILAASGLVAGEALAGVLIAGLVAVGAAPRSGKPILSGTVGSVVVLAAVAALCFFLYRAGRRMQGAESNVTTG